VKNGFQSNGIQRYKCCVCKIKQKISYLYNAYKNDIDEQIILLTKEGLGTRSTSRILKISSTTLLKRIHIIASNVKQPSICLGKIYEVDEMRTFVKRKDNFIWIVYALDRVTKKVVNFNVGRRTNNTLCKVLDTLMLSDPLAIYTDKLKHYKYLETRKSTKQIDLAQIVLSERTSLLELISKG